MTWIKTISFDQATGRLKTLYDRVSGPDNNVDNIMLAHSLRPHSMEGHMALYKSVLHHYGNKLPKWYLEAIGVYVSFINGCDYCFEHHFAGMQRLLGDAEQAARLRRALVSEVLEDGFDARYAAGLRYAGKLTRTPADMVQADVAALLSVGFNDGEVLEINQVTAYFSYANRTVLGLGIDVVGDELGLSPGNSDDPDDWGHK